MNLREGEHERAYYRLFALRVLVNIVYLAASSPSKDRRIAVDAPGRGSYGDSWGLLGASARYGSHCGRGQPPARRRFSISGTRQIWR